MRILLLVCTVFACFGCASIKEDHYFREPTADGKNFNYFRLRVRGCATWSKARYVAGYYDERAVDLFFNEIKSVSGQDDKIPPLFDPTAPEPDGGTLTPFTPSDDHGAFVMILSTNAKAVADAIGQFAENQLVSDAITNIVNRDAVRAARSSLASFDTDVEQSKAITTELQSLFDGVQAANPQPGYLAILNAIARHLGTTRPFMDVAQARQWFEQQGGNR